MRQLLCQQDMNREKLSSASLRGVEFAVAKSSCNCYPRVVHHLNLHFICESWSRTRLCVSYEKLSRVL